MILVPVLILIIIPFVNCQCSTPGPVIKVTGIVMDNYCIDRGTLLDKPSIKTLEKPYEHTIHCLIDIPQCVDSEYALLLAPEKDGGLWSVGYQLGKDGTTLIVAEAERLRDKGLRQNVTLTVSGVVQNVSGKLVYLRCLRIIDSSASISTESGSEVNVQSFRAAHGSLMFIAWIVLTPLGILIARHFKHIGHRWYIYHIIIQSTACIMTLISGILIFVSTWPSTTFDDKKNITSFVHAFVGVLIILGSVLVQPALGKYADYLYRKQDEFIESVSRPIFPDKVHWWLGRLLAVMAIVNVWIGVILFQTNVAWWIGLGILALIIHTALYLTHEARKRRKGSEQFIEMSHRQ